MKSKKKYVISIIFFVILLILTYSVIFNNNDIDDIFFTVKNMAFEFVVIGVFLVFVFLFMEAIYIKISLKSLGSNISLWQGFIYSCTEFYFSAITPSSTGGQPMQAYYMSKDGVPLTKSTVILMLNTVTYKIVIIIMGIAAMILCPNLIFGNSTLFTIVFLLGIVANLNMILLCLLLLYSKKWIRKVVIFLINLGVKIHLVKDKEKTLNTFEKHVDEYQEGAVYIKNNIHIAIKVFLLTFVQRLAMFSVAYVVYKAFGLSQYSYIDLVAVQTAVALGVDSLPLPGGIGASEAMLILIYERVFSESMATPAMLVTRALSYYLCLIISGLTVLGNHLRITFKKVPSVAEGENKLGEDL